MSQPGEMLAINDPRLDEKARTAEILIGVFLPLSTAALILRLYTRYRKQAILTIDDYLAILAYSIWIVWAALCLWGMYLSVKWFKSVLTS